MIRAVLFGWATVTDLFFFSAIQRLRLVRTWPLIVLLFTKLKIQLEVRLLFAFTVMVTVGFVVSAPSNALNCQDVGPRHVECRRRLICVAEVTVPGPVNTLHVLVSVLFGNPSSGQDSNL
jgi:hypothetical protein